MLLENNVSDNGNAEKYKAYYRKQVNRMQEMKKAHGITSDDVANIEIIREINFMNKYLDSISKSLETIASAIKKVD